MKVIWDTLRFLVLSLGIIIALVVFGSGKNEYAALIAGIAVVLMLVCSLMAWRNVVVERETKRHQEMIRALGAVYKAASRES